MNWRRFDFIGGSWCEFPDPTVTAVAVKLGSALLEIRSMTPQLAKSINGAAQIQIKLRRMFSAKLVSPVLFGERSRFSRFATLYIRYSAFPINSGCFVGPNPTFDLEVRV